MSQHFVINLNNNFEEISEGSTNGRRRQRGNEEVFSREIIVLDEETSPVLLASNATSTSDNFDVDFEFFNRDIEIGDAVSSPIMTQPIFSDQEFNIISDDDQLAPRRQQQQQQPQQIGEEEQHDADLDDQNGIETIADALPMTGASTYWSRILVVSLPSIHQVYSICADNDTTLAFLMQQNVFWGPGDVVCPGGTIMTYYADRYRWRCNGRIVDQVIRRTCCRSTSYALTYDSFFYKRKIASNDVMLILYFWAMRVPQMAISQLIGKQQKYTSAVINDWYKMIYHDLCQDDMRIGGEGVVVEIDETVNDSESFITPDGVHTNTIEGTWSAIKLITSPRLRTKKMMPWMLMEFIWRRKHHGNIWEGIMTRLREVTFVRNDDTDPSHTVFSVDADEEFLPVTRGQ
ncbi:hypothetical protein [Parasitella parasitica]|uniref:ISXO2-like transposase domain-containing protein n=1 Tax=Parasitella parasitica TaxID=35722 RepID=A0A0B7N2H1_9FUNG|nr:hypothetical protein [Parasitella parasitica]